MKRDRSIVAETVVQSCATHHATSAVEFQPHPVDLSTCNIHSEPIISENKIIIDAAVYCYSHPKVNNASVTF